MEDFCGSEFWNNNLTWYTDDPDLTPCFQQTVLVYVPCAFLILLSPLELYYILNSKYSDIPRSFVNVSRLFLSAALIVLTLVDLIYAATLLGNVANVHDVDVITPIIKLVAFIVSGTTGYINTRRGIMSSGTQFLFWLLLALFAIPQFRTEIQRQTNEPLAPVLDDELAWNQYKFASYMIYFPLIVLQLISHCFADKLPLHSRYTHTNISSKSAKPSPELSSSFLSKIFYAWFEPTMWRGFRKPLTTDNMYDLNPENTSYELLPLFDRYWQENVEKKRRKQQMLDKVAGGTKDVKGTATRRTNGSVLPAMVKAFGPPFWFSGVIKLGIDLLAFTTPFILGLLIDFTKDSEAPLWQGIFYMVLMCLVTTLTAVLNGQYLQKSFLVGFRIKSSLISAIYRKALTISSKAKRDTTVGEIVNLMAVDAQRFFEAVQYFHLIWAGPVTIALAIYFLWQILGVAVVTGLVVMLLMLPFNAWLATRIRTLQVEQMKKKDDRVKLMNEILNGIKVLKLYAWEPSFEKYIQDVRGEELKTIKATAYLNAITFVLWTISPFLVTLLSFATYVLIDETNVINANTAFVSLTLFNIMRMPLIMFPMALSSAVQCWVAVNRIDKFLNSEDLVEGDVTHHDDGSNAIKIENANFSWGDGELILRNVNLVVPKNTLAAVVGTVGSGKSTLISSILGETERLSGTVNSFGEIAYVPQQAWMQNATLKQNILFGKPLDDKFYDRVLEACALLPDIAMLPGGDETEIGEKGINLSGGQKQRISLARAVYSQADLYLFDDPLSAVDSHVGKHIFEKVIGPNGILDGKTKLLVTHGITYLPQVNTIHVMTGGEITENGPYNKLIDEKGAFATFIEQHLQDMDEDDDEIKEIQSVLGDNKSGARIFNRAISTRSSASNKRKISEKQRTSQLSRHSESQPIAEKTDQNTKLIVKEEEGTGKVKWEVYVRYLKGVGTLMVAITIITNISNQAFSVYSNTWLSEWSEDTNSSVPHIRDMYLGVYGALGILQTVSVFGTSIAMAIGCVNAARDLHNNLLVQTLRLPMSFFDTTPLGRIVNRFSKDVDVVDNLIPLILRFAILMFFSVISVFVVISISTPIFLAVILPLGIIYYFIQSFYIETSRQLKRIESVTRSPVYSHFSETITGQSTIRAYGAQNRFIVDADNRVDYNQKCAYPSLVIANRWLNVRLELIGTFVLLFAILFAILSKDTITGGTVGLSISYALQVTQLLNFLVRMTAEVETNIVANERMEEYNHLPKEAEWITKPVDPEWPQAGKIIFDNYKLRYREGLELVLKGISFTAKAGERIGIVGRTGAGKSSLTLALFRIIEPAGGSILIDDLDISDMGLHSLRSRLTIIPQDPVLFSGTIRMNIDPLKAYADDVIWTALEHSHLKAYVKSTPSGLNNYVSEGGDNLSVGQRQLICLARALLRKTKVLILDEATAAVDLETDDLIQKTIREQFKNCTVLTIAHRLNTIMDSDKVLVLDQGHVAEFDSPRNLLNNKQSVFYGMAKDAGIVSSYTFAEVED